MSGESGGGRKRDRGGTDYLSGYQTRKKKQQAEEQQKKEQEQMRRLDQFYLTSSSHGCDDTAVSPSSSTTNAASTFKDQSDTIDESSITLEGIVISADQDVSETGA